MWDLTFWYWTQSSSRIRRYIASIEYTWIFSSSVKSDLVLANTRFGLFASWYKYCLSLAAVIYRWPACNASVFCCTWMVRYINVALDKSTWTTYQSTIIGTLSYSNNRAMWQKISPLLLDQEFVTHVNELIAGSPVTDQPNALKLFD